MLHLNRRSIIQSASLLTSALWAGVVHPARAAEEPLPARARLNVTENPFGPSPAARTAIAGCVPLAPYYVEDEHLLRDRIGQQENLEREKVALSNGSLDALSLLSTDIGRAGHILAPQPTYATHLNYAQRRGVAIRYVPLSAHAIDLQAMRRAITPQTALVYICNPNNPTGHMLRHQELLAFCRDVSKTVPVIVDEAYFELLPDANGMTVAPLVHSGHDVIVARTFSKVYGLAGLRIGYILAQPPRVRQLYSLTTTSRNQAGFAAAVASLGDRHYLDGAIAYLKNCRQMIYDICEKNGLSYLRSHGTFVYVNTGRPARLMEQALAQHNIDIRVFDAPAYQTWIRVGTATPAELAMFGHALPLALKEVPKT
ncbi:histidinol-phosphate transaminase [Komagataeibacter xylinus]|uniref:pyridoxal phosphate-dependent aminotransferase n=1 Tax=Komagataeibacter xylinus TaxID=28448 RepID=UPI00280B54AF|nr:histidinol-phosphate transaminase [Komagataeibacter xylinus]